jgi:hypothetical protein
MGAVQSAQWMSPRPVQAGGADPTQKLFGKLDLNSDGGIDATELKSFVEAVAEKSGTQSAGADAIMTSLDSDGDGSVSSTELSDNGKALFDQLRQQVMGAMQPPQQPPDIGNEGADRAAPNDGFGRLIQAVLAEYGSTSASSVAPGGALDIAA